MFKKIVTPLAICLLTSLAIVSCKKEDASPSTTTTPAPVAPKPITNSVVVDTSLYETEYSTSDFSNDFASYISLESSPSKTVRLYFPNSDPSTGEYSLVNYSKYNESHGIGKIALNYGESSTDFTLVNTTDKISIVNSNGIITATFNNIKVKSSTGATRTISGIVNIETKPVALAFTGNVTFGSVKHSKIEFKNNSIKEYTFSGGGYYSSYTISFLSVPTANKTYKIVAADDLSAEDEVSIDYLNDNFEYFDVLSTDKTMTVTFTKDQNFTFSYTGVTFSGSGFFSGTTPANQTNNGSGTVIGAKPASL